MNDRRPSRSRLLEIARRAMRERGLLPDFSPAVLAETAALAGPGREASVPDLRNLLWASIDNDDSRDLDQLSVAVPLPGGAVRILVAVADVDACVGAGSAIDGHAGTNTTSVYTAAQIFPMLPERLSTDLTSLNQGEDRLALVLDLTVSAAGEVTGSEVSRALVHNHAKLAYDAVAAWLDGTAAAPPPLARVPGLDEQVRIQDRVAQAMRGLRRESGALGLETREARVVFDGDVLTDVRPDPKNRAKELIEEFMVAANGAAARYLEARGFASLRRVLRSPERWGRIVALAEDLGEHLPAAPSSRALQAFLGRQRLANPARFADLSISVIKLLGSGEYEMQLPGQAAQGHFGLAARDYTHSTAPNRRFPDLVTQRLLKAALAGQQPPYSQQALADLARHCTEQEGDATKIERQVRKSAAALLLESRIGAQFDAVVTGASSKGTWVRIDRPAVEGKLTRGFQGKDVGDRLRVKLVDTDVERGFIDFVPA